MRRTKRKLSYLLVAFLVTYVVPVQSRQAGDQSGISAEEYAIYAAVIDHMFAGDKVSFNTQETVKTLVIEDWTVSNTIAAIAKEDEGKKWKQQFTSISQETIDDYVAKNDAAAHLPIAEGARQ